MRKKNASSLLYFDRKNYIDRRSTWVYDQNMRIKYWINEIIYKKLSYLVERADEEWKMKLFKRMEKSGIYIKVPT